MPAVSAFRLLLLPLLLLLAAGTGRAETWNYLSGGPDGQRAAAVCDLGATGLICLSVLCSDRQDMGLALQFSVPLDEAVEATLSVDGAPAQAVRFERPMAPGAPAVARWDAARDVPLVEALKRGNRVAMSWNAGGEPQRIDLSLVGSSRTITQAMEACPAPLPRVSEPLAYAMERLSPVCRAAGQAFSAGDGFIETPDLDGDGTADAVIDWSKAGCSSAPTYCRRGDCDFTFLYNLGAQGYVPALTVAGKSYQVVPIEGVVHDLQIEAGGPACGKEEGEHCAIIYHSWPGGSPELVGRF